ncbi:poly(U)-specific endoribonuclease-like [Portunus trituberculatus]|uniref:poly(U)-specific endoribonuclease-like n=1 Tax=Portunus trituberculatus TaxID=210409 RepID=UPI001E1CBA8E|nr:poly(U)-specific endoribonuclease-like [Portunus trituberculatus]
MITIPLVLLLLSAGALGQSCVGRCGVNDGVSSCQCNSVCSNFNDCCDDYIAVCLSCKDRCGESYLQSKPCQCNDKCGSHSNCCDDYDELCGGGGQGVTDDDLRTITEEMFAADVNSVYDQLTLDYQGKGSSGDLAPGPLFVSVPESVLSGPTIALLRKVQDNYIPSVYQAEVQDANEIAEQNAFLDAIMNTEVMKLAETFLHSKNLLTGSLRDKLDEMWFTLYKRKHDQSSSGFEHVFVGEQDGDVSGFHNWVNFQKEEAEGDLDYYSWMDSVTFGTKGEVLMNRYNWEGHMKKIGSMFIGTSPELEMATYTVCFLARPDSLCPVQMFSQQFHVQTWTIFGNLVGSAYPDIP